MGAAVDVIAEKDELIVLVHLGDDLAEEVFCRRPFHAFNWIPVNTRKLLRRLASGSVQNVKFAQFRRLVEAFGFQLKRAAGSHHIFCHPDIPEVINIQEVSGEAKPYQIRQFLRLVGRYNLQLEDDP